MKIRIEFTEVEKQAMLNCMETVEVEDENQKVKGKFGFMSYDKDGTIVMEFKEAFILAYCTLIGRLCTVITDLTKLFIDFSSDWFEIEEEDDFDETEQSATFEDMMEQQETIQGTKKEGSVLGTNPLNADLIESVLLNGSNVNFNTIELPVDKDEIDRLCEEGVTIKFTENSDSSDDEVMQKLDSIDNDLDKLLKDLNK